jgi:hypothetical protein
MKKSVVLILAAMFYIAGMAAAATGNWVVAGKDRIGCEKISLGINKARIVLENGEKMVVPLSELESYSSDGMVFVKKVLPGNGASNSTTVFMQLMKIKGNLSLYRNVEYDPELTGRLKSHDHFYVYNGDQLHLVLDEITMPNAFKFFCLKWSYQ